MSAADAGIFVPPALAARVREALRAQAPAADPDAPAPADCLAAGERLLAEVLREGDGGRGAALELLAADALVTRAFELAAADPDSLEALALGSMRRTAELVHGG